MFFSQFCCTLIFIYKQLGSGVGPQSCLYFQGFMGSRLLNVCSAVWSSNLCLQGIQLFQDLKSTFIISDFKIFPKMFSRQLNFCLRPATLLKKRLWHWCFPVNFTIFLRTPFYIEHLWWLLLFDSYFMFIAKGKLYFSLICSFYCCLVKRGWGLKVA